MTALNITAPTGQAPTVTFDPDLTSSQIIDYAAEAVAEALRRAVDAEDRPGYRPTVRGARAEFEASLIKYLEEDR